MSDKTITLPPNSTAIILIPSQEEGGMFVSMEENLTDATQSVTLPAAIGAMEMIKHEPTAIMAAYDRYMTDKGVVIDQDGNKQPEADTPEWARKTKGEA